MSVGMDNVASVLDILQTAVLMNTTEVDQTQQNRVNIEITLDRIAGCKVNVAIMQLSVRTLVFGAVFIVCKF